jgi:hypothetical protein
MLDPLSAAVVTAHQRNGRAGGGAHCSRSVPRSPGLRSKGCSGTRGPEARHDVSKAALPQQRARRRARNDDP